MEDVKAGAEISPERLARLDRARGVAEWYLLRVDEYAPGLLPAAHDLMAVLEHIGLNNLDATITLTNKAPGLEEGQSMVTVGFSGDHGLDPAMFVVPYFEFADGTVPVADFFADPNQKQPDSGLPREFHAISALAKAGSLELEIEYGSPVYFGEYTPDV
jgi:hypothetical protein